MSAQMRAAFYDAVRALPYGGRGSRSPVVGCLRHKRYFTRDAADRALVTLSGRLAEPGELNVYQCPWDQHHWHIGRSW
jgi:hypothetical protein